MIIRDVLIVILTVFTPAPQTGDGPDEDCAAIDPDTLHNLVPSGETE